MRSSIVRIGLVALTALSIAPIQGARAVGPELAPNPGFEKSPTDPSGDVTLQPLLPTGWIFEGAAGLFDHSQNDKHTGLRMAAISIPASTPRLLCPAECVDNPLNAVKDATAKYYTVTPYWRTQAAVPVTEATTYTFSVWTAWTLATARVGGAVTKVRWVDVNGLPLVETPGPKLITGTAPDSGWVQIAKNVKAPSGAKGAILMLGAADDLFITQVKYDDVSFRTI